PDTDLLHADQAREAWLGAESLLRAAWQQAHPTHQPASGGARGSSNVHRRKAVWPQSRSSAEGYPAPPKSADDRGRRARDWGSGCSGVDQNLPDSSGSGAQANLNAWPCATEIVQKWLALHAFHRTHA